MKCNGTENTVEGEQPPSAASNDVTCEKGSASNGSKEPSPSPHPKASPSLNDCVGQSIESVASNESKVEPKLESSRPGSACPEGQQSGNEQWGPQKQEYPSTSTPGGTQTTVSNGPQGGPPQQSSQMYVFTTHMANQAAEAVLSGHFPSIVAYHCAQPNTRRMLEQRRAMMGAMGPGWGGPMGPGGPPMGGPNQVGYMNNHFSGGPGNFPQGPPNGPPFNMAGGPTGPRGMSPMGPGGPMGAPSPMGPGGSPMGPGGSPMGPGGPPPPMGPGGPMGGGGRVKVPDENLTPQQREHREQQLAHIRSMQKWLFPEQGGPGGPPGGPGGPRMMPPHGPPGPMAGGPPGPAPYGPGGPMGAPKGPRGQFPPNPRQGGPGGPPPPQASQYNFRPPDQPRPMSPAMMGHPQSPYQGGPMGGPGGPSPDPSQMGGPSMNFKPSTSPQLHPAPSSSPHLNSNSKAKGSNPMSPVDMPGGMMSSPQHLGYSPMDGPPQPGGPGGGGPGGQPSNDGMMQNDPLASLEGFDSNGMSHPGGPMGGPSPGPGGRMGGPGGPPYGGPMGGGPQGGPRGRTNVQVRPDAPNTIQYLPARSQGPGQSPNPQMPQQRPPSLEFLQRYTRPQDMNSMKGMPPGGSGGPPMGGPMGPMGPMGNGPMGGPSQGGPMGGQMANGPGQPPMQYYPDQQHQQGPPPGAGMAPFNGPPCGQGGGGGPGGPGGPNKPFYGGQTTADPIYAAQFHNFQQQLYATNTTKGLK